MRKIQTEVLVIGGGATGTGVLRDLAMRGFKAILVEKRDLSHGTTGRYHGLLHSGGRYVVKDPRAAEECIAENRILRRIMPHCIEDTGGFFVLAPGDDPEYPHFFIAGCRAVGIPVEEISTNLMLREEPTLNPKISRCFRVPDAAADSFLASELNVASAREYGAQVFTYHPVRQIQRSDDRVVGAICRDLIGDEPVMIEAELTVNASGAWAGKISATAGIGVRILPGKGTMIALNRRFINTVISRCKMPSDADIIVPIHTVSVIGTTDIQVADPDQFTIEPWEVRLMLEEGERLIPGLKDMRVLRAWAGVRPLYQESSPVSSRDVSRAFVLLDHQERDGVDGFVTITSGKWTTFRLMAQHTVDLVCKKLGADRPCRTHLEPVPGDGTRNYHRLGNRLNDIEQGSEFGSLFCECELVSREALVTAILDGGAHTLDDLRRDVRLGMGPCQGGFCTYRAVGLLHSLRKPEVIQANLALKDFLEERWKGLLPVLWGSQLRQERLTELIYINVLNVDRLPGGTQSRFSVEPYDIPAESPKREGIESNEITLGSGSLAPAFPTSYGQAFEWIVIGGGLAGLFSTWLLSRKGIKVALITTGWGRTHWHNGCIDVLGYEPPDYSGPVINLSQALSHQINLNPMHPYAMIGLEMVQKAIEDFKSFCGENGYPLEGTIDRNWLLPTGTGAARPTCLAPLTMIAGDLSHKAPLLIVGLDGFSDFFPGLIAENLNAQGFAVNEISLDLPALKLHKLISPIHLARLFEEQEFRDELVSCLQGKLGSASRIGFPAILGVDQATVVHRDLETQLGRPVFEIPSLPPSVPGIRLHNLLEKSIIASGGRVFSGMQVVGFDAIAGKVTRILSEASARRLGHRADHFVLATGGILGGGIVADRFGNIRENIFNFPCVGPATQSDWFSPQFLNYSGQAVFLSGVAVNREMKPIDPLDKTIYDNLAIAGTTLSGGDYLREGSMEGVDLVSAYKIAGSVAA